MENQVTYFKQYGEMRTGTNYLKRLIELNFKNVEVFGSVLGWKHGLYDTQNSLDGTTSHYEWLDKQHNKDGRVYSVDNYPLKHSYDELKQAIPRLNYIFSIKCPLAFVVSYKRFRFPNKKLHDTVIVNLCNRYNDSYARWKDLYLKHKDRSLIVSYDALLIDVKHVLFNIENFYNLHKKMKNYVDENNPVNASTDHGLLIDRKKKFNKEYYLETKYMDELTTDQVDLILKTINQDITDWFSFNSL